MLNPFVDQHMIKILNEAMMGIRSPESQNQTIKSHSMYFDKNRNVVFVPSKDDSSGNANNRQLGGSPNRKTID